MVVDALATILHPNDDIAHLHSILLQLLYGPVGFGFRIPSPNHKCPHLLYEGLMGDALNFLLFLEAGYNL